MHDMTTAATYFPESYAEARARFLAACADAEIAVEQRPNPNAGPEGEALYSDVAWIGPKDADSVLVVLSGTHGIEGFCGSGIQLGLLQSGLIAGRPNGLAVLLVHAINPYGFAWQRRVTEENVDLNRNWLDHGTTHPANPGYDALHPLLCPRDWSDAAIAESQAALDAWEATHGTVAFRAAVSGGQYSRADGIFFGGTRDTWAKTNLEEVLDGHLASAKRIGLIDIHTGLGPYGIGDRLLPYAPDDPVSLRTAPTRRPALTSTSPTCTESACRPFVTAWIPTSSSASHWNTARSRPRTCASLYVPTTGCTFTDSWIAPRVARSNSRSVPPSIRTAGTGSCRSGSARRKPCG